MWYQIRIHQLGFFSHILLRMIAIRYRHLYEQNRQISRIKHSWSTQNVCFYSFADWDSATDLSTFFGLRWCNLARFVKCYQLTTRWSDESTFGSFKNSQTLPPHQPVQWEMTVVLLTKETCFVPDISLSWTWDEKVYYHDFCPRPLDLDLPPLFHLFRTWDIRTSIFPTLSHFFSPVNIFLGLVCPTPHKKKWGKTKKSCRPPQKKQPIKKTLYFLTVAGSVLFSSKSHRNFHRFFAKKPPPCRSCFGALPPRPCHLLERSLGRLRDAVAGQLREVLSISVSVVSWGGKKPRQGRKARLVFTYTL